MAEIRTETVEQYPVFLTRLTQPCTQHWREKRSGAGQGALKGAVKGAEQGAGQFAGQKTGHGERATPSLMETLFTFLLKTLQSNEQEEKERNRREIENEVEEAESILPRGQILNFLNGTQNLIRQHILMRVSIFCINNATYSTLFT